MPDNDDTILLESVRTHRVRLRGAFLIGGLDERRSVNDNVRRLIGSVVLAAVVCAGCVGTAFVLGAIRDGQVGGATTTVPSSPATPARAAGAATSHGSAASTEAVGAAAATGSTAPVGPATSGGDR
ncbi:MULTISPECIES: hypothetical protein [unclassified Curtobacterium]|uniref:hypothetical protein n=1 Tax=unclassified Curtobacterium TaxID=257496 RepID=UPI0008271F74|nr:MULTISPECIES: hypothetical protein [unclassified Curtobacterium]WIA95343.1 hypothetical protein QOL16_09310 [Curtobacterium sp. MCBA15_004]